MTRLTSDERRAVQALLDEFLTEASRLQALLDSQSDGSDGDTIRLLQPLHSCGLPLDHRNPRTGEPRPCPDETARIALPGETRTRPPVPGSVTVTEPVPCVCGCYLLSHGALGVCLSCGPSVCPGFRTTL